MKRLLLFCLSLTLCSLPARGEDEPASDRTILVFVALCDNESQGIVKVGAAIGDGDKPDANLYWGCDDGFGKVFPRSSNWDVVEKKSDLNETVLRQLELKHRKESLRIIAKAYRGSEITLCYTDFETALSKGEADLVVFIGHNVLMDTRIPEPMVSTDAEPAAIVLACVSERYCRLRLEKMGAVPVLLTQQLMYPGAFLLHDAIESWRKGESPGEIRAAAGRAYARNQSISVRAGTGIFADLKE